ncbi:putative COMM domain containing protein 6 [Histomonas meleagridis]|uniref:putative COMM domain containing protein 6 n=1 Tax=Histomonas meleagridis TaxID=135588 RepID=UPI00355A4474|nr:putative COMM domain containing protein 6 [Histomonas meleagridis]KAH0799093.1 putative COMM domain containing protein 6 [Histomonas meleagridis]
MSAEELKGKLNLIDEVTSLSMAQLENKSMYYSVDWEIGMSVGNSAGDQSPSPFVSLVFKGVDRNGNFLSYPITMSIPQFNDFVQNVQRMQKSLSQFN